MSPGECGGDPYWQALRVNFCSGYFVPAFRFSEVVFKFFVQPAAPPDRDSAASLSYVQAQAPGRRFKLPGLGSAELKPKNLLHLQRPLQQFMSDLKLIGLVMCR